jgi:hypothetical protein
MNNNLEQFSQTLYFMVQTGVPIPTVERKGGSYLSFKIENMKKANISKCVTNLSLLLKVKITKVPRVEINKLSADSSRKLAS